MTNLAINGGDKIRTTPFPQWPQWGNEEVELLEKVLKSGVWGTLGNEAISFADRFAKYQNAEYGILVHNGTISLELIIRGLNIGYGDEVIVPAYTFISTASSVAIAGAVPVFADIDPNTYNIDPESIEEKITSKTKAIIVVHVGGRSCDMDRIMEMARRHGLYIIEDASHAHGSEWKGRRIGAIGDAGSFSFQNSKNLTCGEGGAILTNKFEHFKEFWNYHHSGRAYEMSSEFGGLILMGTNARMAEWEAAILSAQIKRLDEQIERRMENASYLNSKLKEFDFIRLLSDDERITRNSYHLFIFKYLKEKLGGLSREKFISAMCAEGIPCSNGYVPLYKMDAFNSPNFRKSIGSEIDYSKLYLTNTEKASYEEAIWFSGNMLLGSEKDMDDIIKAIEKISANVK
jgi:dTDP-4-amino-4,6-dideoxygalactose transaminase